MAKPGQYCLWLVPSSSSSESFVQTIQQLASQYPPSPIFEPHVTFLTGIPLDQPLDEIVSKIQKMLSVWSIARRLRLNVSLDPPQAGDIFVQAITQPVPISHNSTLIEGRKLLESAFDKPSNPSTPYFPHLSLMYSALQRPELEQIIATEIKEWKDQVELTELTIVRVQGKVEEWKTVKRMTLDGKIVD